MLVLVLGYEVPQIAALLPLYFRCRKLLRCCPILCVRIWALGEGKRRCGSTTDSGYAIVEFARSDWLVQAVLWTEFAAEKFRFRQFSNSSRIRSLGLLPTPATTCSSSTTLIDPRSSGS